jgi:hypothetical protein
MMKTISYAAAGLLALSILGGCSRSEPDEAPPIENVSEEAPPEPEETRAPEPEPAPAPAPVATSNAVAPPPAAEIAPDEQMLDDADATGMTARATRDEPVTDVPPANETEDK